MSTISSCVTRFVAVVLVLLLISLSFWFEPPFRRPCGVRKHEKICLMMPKWCEMKNCHARCPARNGPIGGNSETNCERIRNPQGKRRAWCMEKLWHSLLPVLPWIIPKAGKKIPPTGRCRTVSGEGEGKKKKTERKMPMVEILRTSPCASSSCPWKRSTHCHPPRDLLLLAGMSSTSCAGTPVR